MEFLMGFESLLRVNLDLLLFKVNHIAVLTKLLNLFLEIFQVLKFIHTKLHFFVLQEYFLSFFLNHQFLVRFF